MDYFLNGLKMYATFSGRASRKEFWMYILFLTIGSIIVDVLLKLGGIFVLLNLIFKFGTLIPTLAIACRRLHDINKSGWFMLIPIYNLVLYCMPGDSGENSFGPEPIDAQ